MITQLRAAILRARNKELRQYSLTPIKAAVLLVTKAIDGKTTPAEISRWLFRRPPSVFGLLGRMEKQGLIRQSKNLDRKNMVRVEISEKGLQAYHQSLKRDSIHKIMSSISDEEKEQLKSLLYKIRNSALEEIRIEHELPFP